ncbi:MAG: nitroreductase family protein [Candidatus Omnitrophota bacterium]|nr:MAG: nitroreductase family protein [Candidatus Omnitrophota bacterium]
MSDILRVIKERRSIRKFQTKVPSEEDLRKILEGGRWAPSGLNNQPWRFLVIKDTRQKDDIAQFTKYASVIKRAPLLIVVCMSAKESYNRDKDLMAIGASIQNMLLAAYSLGLGSCWLGEILNKKEALAEFLELKKDLEILAVIALGYPDEEPTRRDRKPLEDLIIMSKLKPEEK